MIAVTNNVIDQISGLTSEQFDILTALLDQFSKTSKPSGVGKRIGIAKGKFQVPADFDDIDYNTSELFGI